MHKKVLNTIIAGALIIFTGLACQNTTTVYQATPVSTQSSPPVETEVPITNATETPNPPTATPPLAPAGYTYVTENTLSVSLARPSGWERDAGTKTLPTSGASVQYVVYYEASAGQIQSISMFTTDQPLAPLTPETLIEVVLGENQQALESQGFKELEGFNNITVANQHTFGMAFRIINPKGLALYSIILPLKDPNGNGFIIQWAANESLASTTRNSFLTMVPTISFTEK